MSYRSRVSCGFATNWHSTW